MGRTHNAALTTCLIVHLLALSLVTATAIPAETPPAPNPAGLAVPPAAGLRPEDMQRLMNLPTLPDIQGRGPFPATYEAAPDGLEIVIYHPIDLKSAARARKLSIYVWGNGACSLDAAGPRFHLTEIASHGFVAVVPGAILSGPRKSSPPADAAGSQSPSGSAAPPSGQSSTGKMLGALNWVLNENSRRGSPYFGLLDPSRVAMGGNSCGGLLAMKASLDPRVKALVLQNSGTFPPAKNRLPLMNKVDLVKLRTPVLYVLGGPEDIAEPNGLDDFEHINQVPVFVADRPGAGHFGVFLEPYGEGTRVELAWLAWQMDHDNKAAQEFVGEHCRLCDDPAWRVHRKGIH